MGSAAGGGVGCLKMIIKKGRLLGALFIARFFDLLNNQSLNLSHVV